MSIKDRAIGLGKGVVGVAGRAIVKGAQVTLGPLHKGNDESARRAILHQEFRLAQKAGGLNIHSSEHLGNYFAAFGGDVQAAFDYANRELEPKMEPRKVANKLGIPTKPPQDISLKGLGNVLGALAKGFTGRKDK